MRDRVRIAHVITRMIVGGAQELVLGIIRALDARGFESVLFTGPETGAEGSLLPRARAAGIEVVEVPWLVRAPRPAKDLLAYGALRRAFRRGRFRIADTYTSKAGFLGTLAARAAGVPVVVYSPQGHIFAKDGAIEGVSGRPVRQKFFFQLRRLASSRADAIVALSQRDLEEQVALGLAPAAKFRVIPNGIDLDRFRPPAAARLAALRESLGLEGRSPIIGAVGRLAAEKGHEDLIEAMVEVRRARPGATLLIAGGGPREAELRQRAERLGLDGSVRFLGVRSDVPEILSLLDVFALTSRYESFGLAILEAMAAARPVVATRVGGIPYLVRDGETGFLIEPRRPLDLAARLLDLAGDPVRAAAMGRAGLEHIRKTFSFEAMVEKLEALYRELLAAKGPPG